MTFLLFLFGVLLAGGLFLILADRLKLPRLATQKAMLSAGRRTKAKARTAEALLMGWAVKLSKYIRMDAYKRSRMVNTLNAAGMNMTPECYSAYAIVKAGTILFGIIPCLLILPLLAPVIVLLAVMVYFKESRSAADRLRAKRDEIEQELPRFVSVITQELKASRDVLGMIENFKRNAGAAFVAELDILTADMRSSSYEAALTRLEARINSPLLSDIVRGLIGLLRGDDGAIYFQMLSHDMKQLELQRLKAQALRIPPKIRVFSFAMLMCFLVTYLAIIVYEIIKSLGGMF
jgi:tight adherence protein C